MLRVEGEGEVAVYRRDARVHVKLSTASHVRAVPEMGLVTVVMGHGGTQYGTTLPATLHLLAAYNTTVQVLDECVADELTVHAMGKANIDLLGARLRRLTVFAQDTARVHNMKEARGSVTAVVTDRARLDLPRDVGAGDRVITWKMGTIGTPM